MARTARRMGVRIWKRAQPTSPHKARILSGLREKVPIFWKLWIITQDRRCKR
jgi:hypothetical protein